MNSILRLIREELNEVLTTKKEKFGSGMEHTIYPSKKHPDRLFKVGDRDVVENWVKIFQSNPELFPKIYRVGKLSKTGNPKTEKYFVEIEKLETEKSKQEWQELEDKLEEANLTDWDDGAFGRGLTDIYMNYENDQKTITHIASELKKRGDKGYDLFIKWFKFIKDCQNAIEKVRNQPTLVDAHIYNFGYGKDGKLKCLDI